MPKEDKSKVKAGDTMEFKVIEFAKESKKIILSHTATWKEVAETETEEGEKKGSRKASKKIATEPLEKTTLGDVFGNLKEELEKKDSAE